MAWVLTDKSRNDFGLIFRIYEKVEKDNSDIIMDEELKIEGDETTTTPDEEAAPSDEPERENPAEV
ncbi:MAG: hypothetical protein KGI72_05445 [Patescibacteria group bacterium]|nr:hypothetical protein [Patescibacteria group bacterium]